MNLLNELNNLVEKKNEEKQNGTYVGANFSKETKNKIKKMIKELKVPNPLSSDKYHTTIIFSRTVFPKDFKALGKLENPWKGKPIEFDIFTGKNGQNCLVLKYECKDQRKRHEFLMDEHKATYDWPEYKIHLTLSYDCGDFDAKAHDPTKYIDQIIIDEEYTEPLQLEWLANKDKKEEK